MAPDFVVTYSMLEQVKGTLSGLKGEFEAIDAVKHAANWGDGGIASAMDGFVSNWGDHRAKLVQSMDAMIKNTEEVLKGARDFDSQMQKQVTPH